MIKKLLITSSFTIFLANGLAPLVLAQTESVTATKPSREQVSACMKEATAEKNAAYEAAKQPLRDARKEAWQKRSLKIWWSARQEYNKAKRAAKDAFAEARKECNASGKMMKKEEERLESALQFDLLPQNNSGLSGKAMLKEENGKVRVRVQLSGPKSDVPQPAHIHGGSCPKPGAVYYPLASVEKGKSETLVDVSLAKLKSELPLAVNLHKSAAESGIYVSCGDLKL